MRVVECNPKFLKLEPYAIERFDILAAHAGVQRPAKHANVLPFPFENAPKHLSGRSPRIAEALQQIAAYEPTSGLPIAEECGQVRALRGIFTRSTQRAAKRARTGARLNHRSC